MSTRNENNSNSRAHAEAAVGGSSPAMDTGGTYRAVAVFLAVIVIAALVYGLVQTAIKASALFTG
ncbi:MFS transporter small subunit [Citricoccus zhacaiensis]